MADHRLLPRINSMQLCKVSEDGLRYLSSIDDMKRFFNSLFLLWQCPDKPKWTFIRIKSQSGHVKDQELEVGRYLSTNFEVGEALEQNPER